MSVEQVYTEKTVKIGSADFYGGPKMPKNRFLIKNILQKFFRVHHHRLTWLFFRSCKMKPTLEGHGDGSKVFGIVFIKFL